MGEDLGKLTVVVLKKRLKAAGLATNGRKADLVTRLVCFVVVCIELPCRCPSSRASTACNPSFQRGVMHHAASNGCLV